ncbi:MAG: hypothetical protein U9R25_18715 [Chloroflexota bacterium]|nr:hypothetical protein [Chloroflexota bacterium]
MPDTYYDPDIDGTLQDTADLIALKETEEEQVFWILFLVRELENSESKEAYDSLLTNLQGKIASRLDSGSWQKIMEADDEIH